MLTCAAVYRPAYTVSQPTVLSAHRYPNKFVRRGVHFASEDGLQKEEGGIKPNERGRRLLESDWSEAIRNPYS